MTDINHRRKNRPPVNQRYAAIDYQNGYAHPNNKESRVPNGWGTGRSQRIGGTDFLDKSMHSWGRVSLLADRQVGAGIGNDYSKSHRGMAKAVKGAKKYVRTRIRFHENHATKKLDITGDINKDS